MGQLLAIMANMATIADTVASVGRGYPKPPEAPPSGAQLPAVFVRPSLDEASEIEWRASREDFHHQLTMFILVVRGENLPDDFTAVVPVMYDVIAAYRDRSDVDLPPTVSGLHPTSYKIGPLGYLDAVYLGATVTWMVKERTAVTLS